MLRGSNLAISHDTVLVFISLLYEFNNYLKTKTGCKVTVTLQPVDPLCFLPPQTNFAPPPPLRQLNNQKKIKRRKLVVTEIKLFPFGMHI